MIGKEHFDHATGVLETAGAKFKEEVTLSTILANDADLFTLHTNAERELSNDMSTTSNNQVIMSQNDITKRFVTSSSSPALKMKVLESFDMSSKTIQTDSFGNIMTSQDKNSVKKDLVDCFFLSGLVSHDDSNEVKEKAIDAFRSGKTDRPLSLTDGSSQDHSPGFDNNSSTIYTNPIMSRKNRQVKFGDVEEATFASVPGSADCVPVDGYYSLARGGYPTCLGNGDAVTIDTYAASQICGHGKSTKQLQTSPHERQDRFMHMDKCQLVWALHEKSEEIRVQHDLAQHYKGKCIYFESIVETNKKVAEETKGDDYARLQQKLSSCEREIEQLKFNLDLRVRFVPQYESVKNRHQVTSSKKRKRTNLGS